MPWPQPGFVAQQQAEGLASLILQSRALWGKELCRGKAYKRIGVRYGFLSC